MICRCMSCTKMAMLMGPRDLRFLRERDFLQVNGILPLMLHVAHLMPDFAPD
ncbi:hypothetical protein TAL182_CH01194 [Rhizobium sp. TAL182]|nr:hypothetical protein TAL182_CH01194 [Rhizobium sp. TAL182]